MSDQPNTQADDETADEPTIECVYCRQGIIEDIANSTHDGDTICDDCSISCEDCGDVHYIDSNDMHSVGESALCGNCCQQCADCGDRERSLGYHNTNDEEICEYCSQSYGFCERCECTVSINCMCYNDRRDQSLCDDCNSEVTDDDSSDYILSYDEKVSPVFIDGKGGVNRKRRGVAYYGIEIEVEGEGNDHEDYAERMTDANFYCKADGSLEDGFEIVSHPATMPYWNKADLSRFDVLRKAEYRSYDVQSCGMHIHLNKEYLSKCEQFKLLTFFKSNQADIVKVSRRRSGALQQWASIEDSPSKVFIEKVTRQGTSRTRYFALNFNNHNTIECRIFRGTLDKSAIVRNIQFFDAIVHYVQFASFNTLTMPDFIHWLRFEGVKVIGGKTCRNLREWFDHMGINEKRNNTQCA